MFFPSWPIEARESDTTKITNKISSPILEEIFLIIFLQFYG